MPPPQFARLTGIEMKVLDLFKKYAVNKDDLTAIDGYFTNFLGISTKADMFPPLKEISGQVFPDLPLKGDGVFAGYGEYHSLLTAIESRVGKDSLTVVELGAGWGPWVSASGVIAQRMGFDRINLVAVEADAKKYQFLQDHLAHNGLADDPSVSIKTLNGAAWYEDGVLHFPKAIEAVDYGGRVSAAGHDVDYRGMEYVSDEIEAISIEKILADFDAIDYLHIDIQGAEYEVLSRHKELMNQKVRNVFVGTHSRMIDANLLQLFHDWGWDIPRSMACFVSHNRSIPTLEGMTMTDGEIFARNPRLQD